jgi:hypothetical protein
LQTFLITKNTNRILLSHSIKVDIPCHPIFLQVNGFTSGIQFSKALKTKSTNRIILNNFLKGVSRQRRWRMKVFTVTLIKRRVITMALRISYLPGAFTLTLI